MMSNLTYISKPFVINVMNCAHCTHAHALLFARGMYVYVPGSRQGHTGCVSSASRSTHPSETVTKDILS